MTELEQSPLLHGGSPTFSPKAGSLRSTQTPWSSDFQAFQKLPFELQVVQDLTSGLIHIVKGNSLVDGLESETLEDFQKRVFREDLGSLLKVEKILLDRIQELNFCDFKELSLNATFRMFFSNRDLKTVNRNSFVHEMDSRGRPATIYHLFKDITGRSSDKNLRFKIQGPGFDENKDLRRTFNTASLSEREYQVLQLLIEGCTSDEISKKLFISCETVNKHRKNMIRKASVSDTRKLVALYLESSSL